MIRTHEDRRSELAGNYIPCMPGVHLGKILRIFDWAGTATVMSDDTHVSCLTVFINPRARVLLVA